MFTWAKLASGLVALFNSILAAFQRKQDRDAGAAAQQLQDANNELEAIRKGDAAATDPAAIQRVRDKYEIGGNT